MDDWNTLYKNGGYGGFGSGTGSILKNNLTLIEWLSTFIKRNNIQSMLDVPCGDMQWIPELLKKSQVKYLGIDYIDYLIESNQNSYPSLTFLCKDILTDNFSTLNRFDLLLCKDLVQHCDKTELNSLLYNLKHINAKFKLVIIPWNSYIPTGTFIHEYQSDFVKKIYLL